MKNILITLLLMPSILFGFNLNNFHSENFNNTLLNPDSIKIQKWFNADTSAFSFTFDDGFITDYEYVKPVLDSFNYKATFYVITGSLTDTLPGIWRYGTWQQFKQLHNEGHEIGSHTVTHPHMPNIEIGDTLTPGTMEYEAYQSKKTIDSIFTDTKCITFAYPYAEYDSDVINVVKKYYKSARALDVDPNPSTLYGNQYFKLNSKVVEFDLPRNSTQDDEDEFNDVVNWLNESIDSSGWAILMIHEVFPFELIQQALDENSYYPMSTEWLTQLCGWIQNKNIWVATAADITKYMHERDCASFYFVSKSDNEYILNLTDTLNNEIYNFPLTLDIIVPDSWDSLFVYQDNEIAESELISISGEKIARINVVPDKGQILLTNSPLLAVNDNKISPEKFKLFQNYPNPFNPSTKIGFRISESGFVTLKVYDMLGREIKTLISKDMQPGNYEVSFNGKNLPSGIYIYRIESNGISLNKKMLLLK